MTKQDYGAQKKIHDIELIDLKTFHSSDGSFTELFRLEGYDKLQFNLSVLEAGAIKAYHEHTSQIDFWTCTEPLLVNLYDGRQDSPTHGVKMRFVLCNQMLKINPGILHGVGNLGAKPRTLLYAVTNFFNPKDPDEIRLPWNYLGERVWEMDKG